MTPEEYLELAGARLQDDGAAMSTATIGGLPAIVGYRPRFRLVWGATRLNLLTVLAESKSVTSDALEQFTEDALAYAISEKGRLRGLQVGVAAIPVLVGATVEPTAAKYAENQLLKRWGAFAWPAAVDLSTPAVYRHQGRVAVGGIFAGWMRSQTAVALPDPRTAS